MKGIEWTDATWNSTTGCSPVSAGCANCWARRRAARMAANPGVRHRERYEGFRPTCWPERLDEPLRWRKPRRVAVSLMGDLFHEEISTAFIRDVFDRMAGPHTFQLLTKRPERMREILTDYAMPNVWLGVSVEDQKTADERIPVLLDTPAAVRFVSLEPMLGPVDLTLRSVPNFPNFDTLTGYMSSANYAEKTGRHLDWVILGGESGPGARPMHPDWARSVRDQCQAAETPFFFKAWGEWTPEKTPLVRISKNRFAPETRTFFPDGRSYDSTQPDQWQDPALATLYRVGKKTARRLLDGRTWDEFPEVETG